MVANRIFIEYGYFIGREHLRGDTSIFNKRLAEVSLAGRPNVNHQNYEEHIYGFECSWKTY